MSLENVLDLLRGASVFLFSVAWFAVAVSLWEEYRSRHEARNPEYRLAIRLLVWVVRVDTIYLAWASYTFVGRAIQGWPGITDVELLVTLTNYLVGFTVAGAPAVMLWFVVQWSDRPTEKELKRRAEVRRKRIEFERRAAR